MAAFTFFDQFIEDAMHGVHNLSTAQLKVALTNTLPDSTNDAVLADITEISSYANLSTRNITTNSSGQTAGVYKLAIADLVLTASGAVDAFRYIVIYNDTAASDNLIGWADYGSSWAMGAGDTLTIDANQVSGLFSDT